MRQGDKYLLRLKVEIGDAGVPDEGDFEMHKGRVACIADCGQLLEQDFATRETQGCVFSLLAHV